MTLRDTQEAHAALLAAGSVMVGLGLLVASFARGLWFGSGLVAVGAAVAITAIALAWKDWKRPPPPPDRTAPPGSDRFWNADARLTSLMGGSAGLGLVALAASLVFPDDAHWLAVRLSATVLLLATTARLVIRRRRR
nr:hypothetical protein [uncultured Microbacterium sp.]